MNHDDLTSLFIDRRRISRSDDQQRKALASPQFLDLTPEIAIARSDFDALPVWDKQRARTLAFGLAADRAILVSRSAAIVHGLWTTNWDPLVELSYLNRTAPPRAQRPPLVIYRRSQLDEDEVTEVAGFRVTTQARTLRDVARYHGVIAGVVAIDSAHLQDPLLRLDKLADGRFAGVDKVRHAVELSTGLAKSPLASEAYAVLRLDAVTWRYAIVQQQEVMIGGCLIPMEILIDGWLNIELSDELTPGRPTDEKLLQEAGIRVLRYSYRDMRSTMLADVRRALRTAGRRPPRKNIVE